MRPIFSPSCATPSNIFILFFWLIQAMWFCFWNDVGNAVDWFFGDFVASSNLRQDSWNVISELEQQISQPILADSVQRVSPRHKSTTFLRGDDPVKIAVVPVLKLLSPLPKEEISRGEEVPFVDHKNVMGCSKKKFICRARPKSNRCNADLYKAVPQPIQNDGAHALIENTAKREQVVNTQDDKTFQRDEGWTKMEERLQMIEEYREVCRHNGKGGLYDAFIDEIERGKLSLHKYVDLLEQYWQARVNYMKNRQIQDTQEWCESLRVGNQVRILIEPLKIAWCFHKKRRNDYSRPKWLHRLEKWQKNGRMRNPKPRGGPSNSKSQKIHSREDSCFWVRVEKSRKLLSSGGPSDDSEKEKLCEVDRYVMGLIGKSAVSADIFLETSTFMQWWRESQAIWEKRMMGYVRHEQLVEFMAKDPRENYIMG